MSKTHRAIPIKYDHANLKRLQDAIAERAQDGRPAWMVWSPTDGPPRTFHEWENDAIRAAEEMARRFPGRPFLVINVCAISVVQTPSITRRLSTDPLPF